MKIPSSDYLKILLIFCLIVFPLITGPHKASAAPLSSIKDVIENSGSGDASNHTITFTTPTGVPADDSTITVTFPAGFGLTSIIEDDVDITDDTVDKTTAANCSGAEQAGVSVVGQVLTIQICNGDGGAIAGGSVVVIEIGDHASVSGTGANKITNHATQATYTVSVNVDSGADTGDALIAIVDDITATVTIDEVLTFGVAGRSSAQCADIANSDSEITTTATSIPFGNPITTENFVDGCQQLTVTTNAGGGYSVTIAEDDQLENPATNTIPDGTCDAGGSPCGDTTAAGWATNTNNGLAYCLLDVTGGDKDPDFDANDCNDGTPYFKTLPSDADSEAPETVMINAGVVSGSQVDVGYRISVSGTQQPGTYTNEVWFVATPTY